MGNLLIFLRFDFGDDNTEMISIIDYLCHSSCSKLTYAKDPWIFWKMVMSLTAVVIRGRNTDSWQALRKTGRSDHGTLYLRKQQDVQV